MCSKLNNHLIETKSWPAHYSDKIKNFLYNWRAKQEPYVLGISSIGTLHESASEMDIDKVLSQADASLLTTGIIKFHFDATKDGLFVVLASSIECAMYGITEQLDGYSDGNIQSDFTYGISKEKIPLLTFAVCDIQQHGRVLAFGPTKFENTETIRIAASGLQAFIDRICQGLTSGAVHFEPKWHINVCKLISAKFAHLVPELRKLAHRSMKSQLEAKGLSWPPAPAPLPAPAPAIAPVEAAVEAAATQCLREFSLRTRTLPAAPAAAAVDEVAETLTNILAPALVRSGESPRQAQNMATRNRKPIAPLPLAPIMNVGDIVEVASCDNENEGTWKGKWEPYVLLKVNATGFDVVDMSTDVVLKGINQRHVRPLSTKAAKALGKKRKAEEELLSSAEEEQRLEKERVAEVVSSRNRKFEEFRKESIKRARNFEATSRLLLATGARPSCSSSTLPVFTEDEDEDEDEMPSLIHREEDTALHSVKPKFYQPRAGISDMADAIKNGVTQGIDSINPSTGWSACWAHVWRALYKKRNLLVDSSTERVDMLFVDMSFIHEISHPELWSHGIDLFYLKWREGFKEKELCAYLAKEIFHRRFGRCHTAAGKPTDTNTTEAFNRVLKSDENFGSVEGLANVMEKMMVVGPRLGRDYKDLAMVPVVPKRDWKDAQRMIRQGWGRLGFKAGDFFIFPSEKLIASFPDEVKTVEQKRAHIKVWIKEYCNLMKNPTTYHKLFDGSWNFDIFMDMIFSF